MLARLGVGYPVIRSIKVRLTVGTPSFATAERSRRLAVSTIRQHPHMFANVCRNYLADRGVKGSTRYDRYQ
jgi:hypothetical protein